jgi:hypothetical protein
VGRWEKIRGWRGEEEDKDEEEEERERWIDIGKRVQWSREQVEQRMTINNQTIYY